MTLNPRLFAGGILLAGVTLWLYAGLLPLRAKWASESAAGGLTTARDAGAPPLADQPLLDAARRSLLIGPWQSEAVEQNLLAARQLRPLYAFTLADLAETYLRTGRDEQARELVSAALRLWPAQEKLLWRAAGLYQRLGDNDQAMETLRTLVRIDAARLTAAVPIAQRITANATQLVSELLPGVSGGNQPVGKYVALLLTYAIQHDEVPLAIAAWDYLPDAEARQAGLAFPYIDLLTRQNHADAARSAWQRYTGERGGGLFNGGFEKPLRGGGLGWFCLDVPGAACSRDTASGFRGSASLRLEFTGTENVSFAHAWQLVPVGERSYRLEGFWRGAGLSTRSGVYIELRAGTGAEAVTATSARRSGSWDWEPFSVEIKRPAKPGFLLVRIRRDASTDFDNRIGGTVWFDQFFLRSGTENPS